MSKFVSRKSVIVRPVRLLAFGLARLSIAARVAIVDAKFAHRQNLPLTPTARVIAWPALAWERLGQIFREEHEEVIFRRYTPLHREHYGDTGRGYQSVVLESQADRSRRYKGQKSRLEFFMDHYPDLVRFADGDSFLDFGCGTGQNIRTLAERFSGSQIVGYDLNASAIELIADCEVHPGVSVAVGDLTDEKFRVESLREGFDHIVLSHVFSLVFGASRIETLALRKRIILDLVSACHKSLIILDTFGGQKESKIEIEQRQRAMINDDILDLFLEIDDGRAFLIASDRTRAVVFLKNNVT